MYATEKRPAENYVPCRAFWAIVHTVVSRGGGLILTPDLSGGIISVNPRAFRQFEDIFRSPHDPAALGTVMVFHRTGEVEHRDSGIQARIVRCGQFIGKSDKQYPVSVHNKAVGLQV